MPINGDTPLVSIIIPTKKSSHTLSSCLQSAVNQTYANIEVIVVDNYSSDATRVVAMKYTKEVFATDPERSIQSNFGAKIALGKYVYRVDSDFVLDSNLIFRESYIEFLRHPVLGLGFVIYQVARYLSSACGILVCLISLLSKRLFSLMK